MTAGQGEGVYSFAHAYLQHLVFCLLCKNSLGLTCKKQVRKEKAKRMGDEAPAELAQTNALRLLDRQQHRENASCYTEGRLASTLDQMHLTMQVCKLAVSPALFFQKFQQEKVLLHLRCVSLCTLPVKQPISSLLPAGTNSEPCLAVCYLTVLSPEHHPGRP